MTTKLFLMFFKLLLDLIVGIGKENNLLDMIRIFLTNCLLAVNGINLFLVQIQTTFVVVSSIDTEKFLEAQDFIHSLKESTCE